MGNEVAIIDRQPVVPVYGLSDLERIATAIARGGLFGSKDPNAVLTLCMLAQAEGQHPAVVFRDYDLIQGKPAKKAEAMLRDFIAGGGKVTWNQLDDECADATFSHPQGGTITINWTMARAQKAQLGGKEMWKKYPRQMLRSRVVSEGVRTVYPNATSGLYVPEEVRDFDNTAPNDTPPTPEPKRARDLKQIEAKAEKPDPKRTKAETWLAWLKDELAETDVDGAKEVFATPETVKNLVSIKAAFPDIYEQAMQFAPEPEQPNDRTADDEQPAEVNDADEPHPAIAIADKIIAEINDPATNAVMDVAGILNREQLDIAAMPDEQAVRVEIAADQRRNAIRAEQAAAKAKESETAK